jgi:hypothetical protein
MALAARRSDRGRCGHTGDGSDSGASVRDGAPGLA